MSAGVRRLRDVLEDRREQTESAFFAQGVVTAVGPGTALTVRPAAAEPGAPGLVVTRLRSFDDAKVGDVVLLAGPPGSWTAIGALA